MSRTFGWSPGTWLPDLADLPSPAELGRVAGDLADRTLDRSVRVAITGLCGGGKTVFITAALHHLLNGQELPFLGAAHEGRLRGVRLLPPEPGDPPPFPFEAARAALAAPEPRWPAPTDGLTSLRLELRYGVKGTMRRWLGEHRSLYVQIIDYPGEWLLDLALLGQSFEDWSSTTLTAAEQPGRAELAKDWRGHLASLDPSAPADLNVAATAAHHYTDYLHACRGEAGLSKLQPGRFTMPGDLAGSEQLQFCPLAPSEAPRGSLYRLMRHRYHRYRDRIVAPFYRKHFSRFDRQLVLVDLLAVLNRGPACFADAQAALGAVLDSFRYGPNHLLARLFRPQIERLVFAASKADHVAHNQHHNLRLLLEQMVAEAARSARFEGVDPTFIALAALKSTDVVRTEHHGQVLSCVRGRLKDEDRETVLFPGEIPPDLPDADDWRQDRFRFRAFSPRRLALNGPGGGAAAPQHIRLDQALEALLGDRLQ